MHRLGGARPRLLRREDDPRRRLLPGVDQGHRSTCSSTTATSSRSATSSRARRREAAKWASVPVINCGDGWGEHPDPGADRPVHDPARDGHARRPDLPARRRHADADDALDPATRCPSSTAEAIVVAPPDMSLLPEFKAELDALNVAYREADDVRDVIGEADIIYMEPVVQADYTPVARRARRRDAASPRREYRSPASCCARRPSAARSSSTRCRAWTS